MKEKKRKKEIQGQTRQDFVYEQPLDAHNEISHHRDCAGGHRKQQEFVHECRAATSWLWPDFQPGEILEQACSSLEKFASGFDKIYLDCSILVKFTD